MGASISRNYSLVLDNAGEVKNAISTTKKYSWIIIRKTSSGSDIIDKSAGWVFS